MQPCCVKAPLESAMGATRYNIPLVLAPISVAAVPPALSVWFVAPTSTSPNSRCRPQTYAAPFAVVALTGGEAERRCHLSSVKSRNATSLAARPLSSVPPHASMKRPSIGVSECPNLGAGGYPLILGLLQRRARGSKQKTSSDTPAAVRPPSSQSRPSSSTAIAA
eukprot:scaffold236117_cov28-Tisochrysis_lutea.AAC.5